MNVSEPSSRACWKSRETYRLHGHLTGELRDQQPQMVLNLTASPEWVMARTRLLEALERHPAALSDVRRALEASSPGTPKKMSGAPSPAWEPMSDMTS
jgi:hypothetical protein